MRPNRRAWTAALLISMLGAGFARGTDRPNIILAMTDDQGWGETGYYGHPHLKTPTLDSMAANGLRMDRFYSADPVCSPTRASVLTGRHPVRSGVLHWNFALRTEEITIAELLRDAGYATGHFGKWHLGPVESFSPAHPGKHGFDEYLSHDNFFELNPPLSHNGAAAEIHEGEGSEIIVQAALDYITTTVQKQKPFFVVVWFGSPHGPFEGTEKDLSLYSDIDDEILRHRFAEITAMDRAMGWLRTGLRETGVANDTLLWFCSDNGIPGKLGPTAGLRGSKGQMYEGGIKVPGIIEWPARIPEGRKTGFRAVTSDIFPTLADIAGLELPDRPYDGISLKGLIDGTMERRGVPLGFWKHPSRDWKVTEPWFPDSGKLEGTILTGAGKLITFLNYQYPNPASSEFTGAYAWQEEQYKLVLDKKGNEGLFDISKDPVESSNLLDQMPERVTRMKQALDAWRTSVEQSYSGADY